MFSKNIISKSTIYLSLLTCTEDQHLSYLPTTNHCVCKPSASEKSGLSFINFKISKKLLHGKPTSNDYKFSHAVRGKWDLNNLSAVFLLSFSSRYVNWKQRKQLLRAPSWEIEDTFVTVINL